MLKEAVEIECRFVEYSLKQTVIENGIEVHYDGFPGLNSTIMKQHIYFVADNWLGLVPLSPIYHFSNPLDAVTAKGKQRLVIV